MRRKLAILTVVIMIVLTAIGLANTEALAGLRESLKVYPGPAETEAYPRPSPYATFSGTEWPTPWPRDDGTAWPIDFYETR